MKNGFQIRHALPLVLVAFVIAGEVIGWGAVYKEARLWQAGIAGLIGFGGLTAAALYHARKTQQRDDRLHATERRLSAAALCAELAAIRAFASRFVDDVDNIAAGAERLVADHPPLGDKMTAVSPWQVYPTVVYDAAARDVGMLGSQLGTEVVRIYSLVKRFDLQRDELPEVTHAQYPHAVRTVAKSLRALLINIDPVLAELSAFDPDADDI